MRKKLTITVNEQVYEGLHRGDWTQKYQPVYRISRAAARLGEGLGRGIPVHGTR
ncbi:MAG: hypothetical protein ABSG91_05230 [Syntrophobacteraceae bacterium]